MLNALAKLALSAIVVVGLLASFGCTPPQVERAQADQAMIQAVLNGACGNPAIEAILAAAVPGGSLGCVGGMAGAAVVTAVMNDPVLVARVEAMAKK